MLRPFLGTKPNSVLSLAELSFEPGCQKVVLSIPRAFQHIHVHMHVHTNTHLHIQVCQYLYPYLYMYIYTYTYIYIGYTHAHMLT